MNFDETLECNSWVDRVSGKEFIQARTESIKALASSLADSRCKVYYGNIETGTCDTDTISTGYIIETDYRYSIKSRKNSNKAVALDVSSIVRIVDTKSKLDILKHENFNFWEGLKVEKESICVKDIFNTELSINNTDISEKLLEELPLIIVYNSGDKVVINDCLKSVKESTGLLMEVYRERLYKEIKSRDKMTETLDWLLNAGNCGVGVLFKGCAVIKVDESLHRLINIRDNILGRRSCM